MKDAPYVLSAILGMDLGERQRQNVGGWRRINVYEAAIESDKNGQSNRGLLM